MYKFKYIMKYIYNVQYIYTYIYMTLFSSLQRLLLSLFMHFHQKRASAAQIYYHLFKKTICNNPRSLQCRQFKHASGAFFFCITVFAAYFLQLLILPPLFSSSSSPLLSHHLLLEQLNKLEMHNLQSQKMSSCGFFCLHSYLFLIALHVRVCVCVFEQTSARF